jgi:hypothetical protein
MFQGFIQLESTLKGILVSRNVSSVPIDADAYPTYRVYGSLGYLGLSGTCSFLDSGTITGASNASPIVITCASHGLTTGARITISGVGGNTAANGTFVVTRVDANSFSLDGSTGNGAYTSGGNWHVTGAYSYSIAATALNGFAAGENYRAVFNWAISSAARAELDSFCVV